MINAISFIFRWTFNLIVMAIVVGLATALHPIFGGIIGFLYGLGLYINISDGLKKLI